MLSGSANAKVRSVAALVLMLGGCVHFASAQASGPSAASPAKPAVSVDNPRLKKYLDANGGYKDSLGGYFDAKAGTYTTKDRAVVDNWHGLTGKDGSYRSALGEYWDAPNHTAHMADGSQAKLPATSDQVIKLLREDVEAKGGYDKTFILTKMMELIQKEHPLGLEQIAKPEASAENVNDPRLRRYLDAKGGYMDHVGGYYDPKAGTYTDKEGGVVDNWSGYIFKDGSYRSKLGDHWDAPTHTFRLADGRERQVAAMSNADAMKALRQKVEELGAYDKDFLVKAMMTAIGSEHPLGASKTH